jgi:hypothetical protein
MQLKYNPELGMIVKENDEPATQADILAWSAANPEPVEEERKKQDPRMLNELMQSLTGGKTSDTVDVGVETIKDKG